MSRRRSTPVFVALSLLATAFAGCFVDAALLRPQRTRNLAATQALTARLGLADLALFSEARYTRHPAQADLHSAFQDHPLALEHFPSGSLLPPRHEALVRTPTTSD
jgi:hypothetical protein